MRPFLLKVMLILIPTGLFLAGLEAYARTRDNSDLRYKSEYFRANAGELRGLVFGPSHSWRAVDPAKLDYPTASLAFSGSAINTDFLVFRQALKKASPDFVLFDLSAAYLEKRNPAEFMNQRKLYYYFGVPNDQLTLRDHFLLRQPTHRVFEEPERERTFTERGFEYDLAEFKEQFKFLRFDTTRIANFISNQSKKQQHNRFSDGNYAMNRELLGRLAALCRERNIKLIFWSPPKYFIYNDFLLDKHRQRRERALDGIVDGETVFFWNLERFGERDPTMFMNMNHVRPAGTARVAEELNRRLKAVIGS